MRPLRSLMLGDCDHYLSPYIFGVGQAMARLGHWHSTVNLRQPLAVIEQRIADVRPDVLWTHMLLWPPPGAPPVADLVGAVELAARAGAKVIIHDGDCKVPTRYPRDLSRWCALALCNHRFDRSAWKVPTIHWPYFAFAQGEIAPARPELGCDLFFAGTVGAGPTYATRTAFLEAIRRRGVRLRLPPAGEGNTLFRTAEIAASSGAVLGFGRAGAPGWIDTRVFQYPGAGAILLHDDVGGLLEPWVHFVPYRSGDAASVVDALARLRRMQPAERQAIRERAFDYVQQHHSSVARVHQVLRRLEIT
jgi:hypothetical protein